MATQPLTSYSGTSPVLVEYPAGEMFDCHLDWRQADAAVEQTSRHWFSSATDRRRGAHAVYVAALDQEQATATR